MIVDVHDGTFCSGVWDAPLLNGVPVQQAFYADDERGIIRTYDLGDGKPHSTPSEPAMLTPGIDANGQVGRMESGLL